MLGHFPRLAGDRVTAWAHRLFLVCKTVADSHKPLRFATVTDQGMQWRLKRNCALTPQQVAMCFCLLCVMSCGVGLFFWSQGVWQILPFTAVELLMVGVAFVLYARHATDGECIRLEPGRLVVELESAGRLQRTEFARDWVRIEPRHGDGSLIEVYAGNRKVRVGRFMRAELRPALAREIRQALRGAA